MDMDMDMDMDVDMDMDMELVCNVGSRLFLFYILFICDLSGKEGVYSQVYITLKVV